jgi:hydroxymethylglutaryl-CoA lyase
VDSIIEAYLAVGIKEISLSDASGMATPQQVGKVCRHVAKKYPEASWWLHFHNTRGMAMANVIAAMDAGMTQFDTSFGGLGGCPFVPGAAGNISTEDVLHMCDESGIETGIDLAKLMELSRTLKDLLHHDTDSYVLRAGRSCDLLVGKD